MSRLALSILVLGVVSTLSSCGDGPVTPEPVRPTPAPPPFAIVNATATSGFGAPIRSGTEAQRYIVEVKSTGVGLFDYDRDGLLDVVFTAGSTLERQRAGEPGFGTRLYRNLGGLRFEDVTEAAGLPATGWASAPVCADYDGDGWTDLYVTHFGCNMLFRNVEGRFTDVTAAAGVGDEGWGTSAVFHDIDGDGDLDLYVCNYLRFDVTDPPRHGHEGLSCLWKTFEVMCGPKGLAPAPDVCYRNEGNGRFVDVTAAWGVAELEASYGLGIVAGDFDADGKAELYVANDGMANFWLDWEDGRLQENGYFSGVALSEGGAPEAGMGVDAADLNGDGLQDLICTNFSEEVNDLYVSREGGLWVESSATSGLALTGLSSLGWGVGLQDFDLDGRLDVFIANGHVYPEASRPGTGTSYPQLNTLLLGRDGVRFEPAAAEQVPGLTVKKVSRGAAFGDLDNDGDVDVVVVNLNDTPTLLENKSDPARLGHHWLGVRVKGTGLNPDGIGALVTVKTESRTRAREVRRTASFQASNDPRLVFGLGADSAIGELRVRWPDGLEETFPATPDSWVELTYGSGKR